VGRLLPDEPEEIEWITRNLFVGNKLWSGRVRPMRAARPSTCARSARPSSCSPRWATTSRRRSRPSTGWVDVYGSTAEIKANGQVIVGLLHEDIGHLGIFVSGKVARKEHAQIVSVLEWMSWFAPAMQAGNADRKGTDTGQPLQRLEKFGSEMISASLDYYRGMRDAGTEAGFFSIYANMFSPYLGEKLETDERAGKMPTDPRELPFVKEALTSIAEGGYTEACARVARLLTRSGEPLPLSRLALRGELADNYAEYLPEIPMDQWRRMRGEQEIIVRFEPDQALLTKSISA
jgi:hypothetical protein